MIALERSEKLGGMRASPSGQSGVMGHVAEESLFSVSNGARTKSPLAVKRRLLWHDTCIPPVTCLHADMYPMIYPPARIRRGTLRTNATTRDMAKYKMAVPYHLLQLSHHAPTRRREYHVHDVSHELNR